MPVILGGNIHKQPVWFFVILLFWAAKFADSSYFPHPSPLYFFIVISNWSSLYYLIPKLAAGLSLYFYT